MFMRHRIAVATLGLLVLGVAASSASAAVTYRYKVTVSGSLTHNFQANGDDPCAPVGPGSMVVKFKTAKPARVRLRYDFQNGLGWLIKGKIPLTGTRTNRDHTAPRPDP